MSELLSKCVHCDLPRSKHLTAMKYCDTNQTRMFSPKPPVSEPTIEEMRNTVLAMYPTAAIFPWDDRLDILGIGSGDGSSIIHLSDPMYATDDILWKSAYSKLPAKAAPESEDEAFERAWRQRVARGVPYDREEFRHGWNARARLDAERGK